MGKLALTGNSRTRKRFADLSEASAPFDPLTLPNLWAWYDASNAGSITSSGGAVSQWNDLSGNTRHVTQGTAGAKPTTGSRTQNGLNVLDFDGGDTLTIGSISFGVTNWTVYFVGGEDTTANNRGIFCFNTGVGNDWERTDSILFENGNSTQLFGLETGNPNSPGVACAPACAGGTVMPQTIYILRKSGTGANSMSAYCRSTGVTTQVTAASAGTATNLIIGGRLSGAGKLDGYIAEMLVCSSAHSSGDQTATEAYLAAKWAL
jgi:hypothetical protein